MAADEGGEDQRLIIRDTVFHDSLDLELRFISQLLRHGFLHVSSEHIDIILVDQPIFKDSLDFMDPKSDHLFWLPFVIVGLSKDDSFSHF